MTKLEKVGEQLSLFNNLSFTKKQWDIILRGCGCPKAPYLWTALRQHHIVKEGKYFTMADMNATSYCRVYEEYCIYNRSNVSKHAAKVKARKKAESLKGFTVYVINGVITRDNTIQD